MVDQLSPDHRLDGTAVIAGGDTAEMLELIEKTFDAVSQLVCDGVMRDENLAGRIAGDDGFGSQFGDQRAQGIAVEALSAITPPASQLLKSAGACVMSPVCPAVMMKRSGRPDASASAWILLVNPPRERPKA